jgi:hypothetical protein
MNDQAAHRMLISLHLPKTAGSSLRNSLQEHYGPRLIKDYLSSPTLTPRPWREIKAIAALLYNGIRRFQEIECIHGHFLPFKYLLIGARRNAAYITWMRDPVERLASNYWYMRNPPPYAMPNYIREKMMREQWTLEQYLLAPELRNECSIYLWGMSIKRFDFIGLTEHFDEDFRYFCRVFLGTELPAEHQNRNTAKQSEKYVTDPDLYARVAAFHAKDMAMYQYALKQRAARISEEAAQAWTTD